MTVFRLVLILLTGEEHFFIIILDLFFCWIILTTVFPSLVNDREDASYLIVLFYSQEILVAYSCCKVNKKVFMISVWLLLDV